MKTMRFRVLPYKQGSRSAKALAEALEGKVLKLEGSTFKPKEGDVIINWGNASQVWDCDKCFNYAPFIKTASNKLNFFNLLESQGFSDIIPPFWTNQEDIPNEDFPIVCRTILSGHSGSGIVIADNRDGLVAAPLYVKYVKKKDEYRVHCGKEGDDAKVIAVARKARRLDHENPNWQVRSHANGFNFVRNDVNPPTSVTGVALQAFYATGLDFGAVDVIWNEHESKAYVLEINTAPGLEGQTVTDYANFFRGVVE